MAQRIEALADQNGGLHLAMLEDGTCWWLSACAGFAGTMRHVMAGLPTILSQKYAPNQLRTSHEYEALIGAGADIVAILEDGKFVHRLPKLMDPAAQHWLEG